MALTLQGKNKVDPKLMVAQAYSNMVMIWRELYLKSQEAGKGAFFAGVVLIVLGGAGWFQTMLGVLDVFLGAISWSETSNGNQRKKVVSETK